MHRFSFHALATRGAAALPIYQGLQHLLHGALPAPLVYGAILERRLESHHARLLEAAGASLRLEESPASRPPTLPASCPVSQKAPMRFLAS